MRYRLRTLGLLLFTVLSRLSFAVEPPFIKIEEALARGKVAFLAHAVKVELISTKGSLARARMKLAVDRCYYGSSCRKVRWLTMTYVSQSFVDDMNPVMPVTFVVGRRILFVLQSDPRSNIYRFNSDLRTGPDLAFQGATLPLVDPEDPEAYWESVYFKSSQDLPLQTIERLAALRSTALRDAKDARSPAP